MSSSALKTRVQIFIEHDIVLRHFVLNGCLPALERDFEVQFVFPVDKRLKQPVEALGLRDWKKIPIDSPRVNRLRHLSKIQTLSRAWFDPRLHFLRNIWKCVFSPYMFRQMMLLSLPGMFQLYKWKVLRNTGPYPELEQVIRDFKPDVIIHPSVLEGLFISDLCQITERERIPFFALMNSWDNPSTKAMVLAKPRWLYVWGEQTSRHAVDFMQMPEDRVIRFGAAQFDVYREAPRQTREEYLRSMGIDPGKRIILYAGSSKSVNEMEHLQSLEKAILSGELSNAHVLFRPHPWRSAAAGEKDFFELRFQCVTMDSAMIPFYNRVAGDGTIHLTDYRDTHQILSSVDLVCSNVSTIMLEAALHEKPVLCMVTEEDQDQSGFLKVVLEAPYFQDLLEKLQIPVCAHAHEFARDCSTLLEKGASSEYRRWLRQQVSYFIEEHSGSYTDRLADEIRQKTGKR